MKDNTIQKIHPTGKVLVDLGEIKPRFGNQPLMPNNVNIGPKSISSVNRGWITYAQWFNAGHPISLFKTTYIVPPSPLTQSNQTIFLFSGIQNSTMIYQPVLQWGKSAAGGGKYWSVARWYADGLGGSAYHSDLVKVNSGDTLIGIMTLTNQKGNLFYL
jgi:hypothetical protein